MSYKSCTTCVHVRVCTYWKMITPSAAPQRLKGLIDIIDCEKSGASEQLGRLYALVADVCQYREEREVTRSA